MSRTPRPWAVGSLLAGGLIGAGILLTAWGLSPERRVTMDSAVVQSLSLAGKLAPGETRRQGLEFRLPGSRSSSRLRIDAERVEVSLAGNGATGHGRLHATLRRSSGEPLLDAVLNLANPMSFPHGPPRSVVSSGAYSLVLANEEASEISYDLRILETIPIRQEATSAFALGRIALVTVGGLLVLAGAALIAGSTRMVWASGSSIVESPRRAMGTSIN